MFPVAAPTTKFKSIEIFTSYPSLSTLNLASKADRGGWVISLTNGGPFRRKLRYDRRSAGLFTPLRLDSTDRVDHRGADIAVAEEFLNRADVVSSSGSS
jgi:hypothetical protein